MKWLEKAYRVLLAGLAPALYLSYFPVIRLGGDATMNYELSVALIFLVMFDLCAMAVLMVRWRVASAVRRRQATGAVRRLVWRKWLWLLFPLWVTASVAWSLNATRGILTVGVMWVIVIAIVAAWELRDLVRDARYKMLWWRIFFGSTLVVCLWCVVQCVMDLVGVPREVSQMCAGCVSEMFGFPHPNGFAIEPQFMGNLLIAPAMLLGWPILRSGPRPSGPSPRADDANSRAAALRNAPSLKYCAILFFIVVSTLFLTFSRGAIYAFIVGLIVVSFVVLKRGRARWRRVAAAWGVVVLSFVVTLNVQGLMAAVGPTDDTYFTGITKVLNHLSLGTIDVHATSAVFDGYVEESTETRLRLTTAAVAVWMQDFKNVVVGVGIGGAGQALYDAGFTPAPKEIVQNEYASLLLETGAVGVILAAFVVTLALAYLVRLVMVGKMQGVMLIGLVIAYGVSLFFFSGLPNALQIYLMPPLMCIMWNCADSNGTVKLAQDKTRLKK